jgi:hypothetical protein
MTYYVIKYTGTFGYIKPWTAVRDEKTFSQQFLTPSIVSGMSQKIFGLNHKERILRHRLNYARIDLQKELTRPKWRKDPEAKGFPERGILLHPHLYLAFASESDAKEAFSQHLCLCRNEDIVLPDPEYGIQAMDEKAFDAIIGFELKFNQSDNIFPVGYNRYEAGNPMMYGELLIQGDPVRNQEL